MKTGVVPFSWTSITGLLGARPHLALLEKVNQRGIGHDDLKAVALVWKELNEKAAAKAKELQARSAKRARPLSIIKNEKS